MLCILTKNVKYSHVRLPRLLGSKFENKPRHRGVHKQVLSNKHRRSPAEASRPRKQKEFKRFGESY
jgi:hypothetical protein